MKYALALCLALITGCAIAADFIKAAPSPVSVEVRDRSDRAVAIAAIKGKVTLLHFWASWCASCREEFPALDRLQRDLGVEGFRVITVSIDRMGWPVIDKTVEKLEIRDAAVYHDLNRVASQALKIEGLPTTLLLDAEGREVARMVGSGDWDTPALRQHMRVLATP